MARPARFVLLAAAALLPFPAGALGVGPAVEARAVLAPRMVLFGDTLTARVEVTLDRRRADPGSVRVAAEFAPWEPVVPPRREQRQAGDTVYLRITFLLRCLTSLCVPPRETAQLELSPARVTYIEAQGRRRLLRAPWPVLVVHSRIVAADFRRPDVLARPWTADLVSLPPVSYRVDPAAAMPLLIGLAGLSGVAGLAFAWLAARRAPRLAPPPQPPAASPLERAVAVLEGEAGDGAAERRRALQLVAEALAERGEPEAAGRARALAWSEAAPPAGEARRLAARLRAALGEEVGGEGPEAA